MSDASKRLILARRARFLAATAAAVAVSACAGDSSNPKPCLSPLTDSGSDAKGDADAEPQPCLEVEPPDAGDASG